MIKRMTLVLGLSTLVGCAAVEKPVLVPVFMLPPCAEGTQVRQANPQSRELICVPAAGAPAK
jgi:hypothetical protein